MSTETQLRGLQRILAQEVGVSDLLQFLTDSDPLPWQEIVGFVPSSADRERSLARIGSRSRVKGTADLVLGNPNGGEVLLELKLGHEFSADQRDRYEQSTEGRLILAGLADDQTLVDELPRWEFRDLASILHAWTESSSAEAALLARLSAEIIGRWSDAVSSVFSAERTPLVSITHKFLARVVSRRVAHLLADRGRESYAGVTSGGGLALVQGWALIDGDRQRRLIAEVRWNSNLTGGALRIGVDYFLPETTAGRAEAWELAKTMDSVINIEEFRCYLEDDQPHLVPLLKTRGAGRRPVAEAVWRDVVDRGFQSRANPDGVPGSRRQHNPGFLGDGTQRFEAGSDVDFSRASAADLVDLLESSLRYLEGRRPELAVLVAWNNRYS